MNKRKRKAKREATKQYKRNLKEIKTSGIPYNAFATPAVQAAVAGASKSLATNLRNFFKNSSK